MIDILVSIFAVIGFGSFVIFICLTIDYLVEENKRVNKIIEKIMKGDFK